MAHSILQRESTRLGADLDRLVPVRLCGAGPAEPPARDPTAGAGGGTRRVFLSSQQGEDLLGAVDGLHFVIDTGVEKRFVSAEVRTAFPDPRFFIGHMRGSTCTTRRETCS